MNILHVINRRLRREEKGVQVAGDVNAVVSANVGEPGSRSGVSSRQRTKIVQRSGSTVVAETRQSKEEGTG